MRVTTALHFGAAGAAGAVGGTALNRLVSGRAILFAFAAILLLAAWRIRRRPATTGGRVDSLSGAVGAGLVTGVLTGFLGIGGGFVIVPVLVLLLGLPMQAAVGTSLAIIALTSAAAFAAHVATGDIDWAVASSFAGIAILGALAGRRIGSRLDQRQLAAAFTALLVVVAVLLVAENVYALVTG